MRSKLAFAAVILAALWTSEARLAACSCVGRIPACQATWEAAVVFAGQVVDIRDSQLSQPQPPGTAFWERRRVRLKVSEVFRGDIKDTAVVFTGLGGGDCGYGFTTGASYLIYAHRVPTGQLTTGICSRTKSIGEAAEDLAYLRGDARRQSGLGLIFGTARYPNPRLEYEPFETAPPYPGGRVTVEATDPGRKDRYEAMTGPDGNYSVRVPAGKYRASLGVRDGLYSSTPFMPVEIIDLRGCSEASFIVRPDGRIGGRVLDAEGKPVPALSVEIVDESALQARLIFSSRRARTGPDGAFEFRELAPTGYALGLTLSKEVRDTSWNGVWFGAAGSDLPKPIRIEPEERAWIGEVNLPASIALSSINGLVTIDGAPAVGANVYVRMGTGPGPSFASVLTDANGRFTFTLVAGKSYRIAAEVINSRGQPRVRNAEAQTFTAEPGTLPALTLTIK